MVRSYYRSTLNIQPYVVLLKKVNVYDMDQGMSQASIIEMKCIIFVCDMVKYYGSH